MKFWVRIGDRETPIEIERNGEICKLELDSGDKKIALAREIEPGVYSVLMDGRSFEARADGDGVSIRGRRFVVQVRDPRRWSRQKAGAQAEGLRHVIAPMPGRVVRLLVSRGERVELGQGLVVVEAMKMQNAVKAPKSGVVVATPAREGVTVTTGEILVTIE